MSDPEPPASSEIEALIADFQNSDLRELHVRADGFELYLSKDREADLTLGAPRSAAPSAGTSGGAARPQQPDTQAAPAATLPAGTTAVVAPYLGTFYRAPKPGAPAFVEIGARVAPETELCLVEVMKLFTSVRAGVAGTVEAVLAQDGQMVEADQPLFAIRAD